MKDRTHKLFEVNSDISILLKLINEIGWKDIRESSIHRILYLSSVLHAFMENHETHAFNNYHFSLTPTGPYSEIIESSLVDLKSREIITEDGQTLSIDIQNLKKIDLKSYNEKIDWFETIIYILGIYGESKIFGFIIQDPQYKDDFLRNSQTEIDISAKNKSVQTLNSFKKAFEDTLDDASGINQQEYLELYFEYVFSKIIKK
jgi:hypothetical protein